MKFHVNLVDGTVGNDPELIAIVHTPEDVIAIRETVQAMYSTLLQNFNLLPEIVPADEENILVVNLVMDYTT